MTLLEILHTLKDEEEKGIVNVDDWKFSEAGYLKDMGFDFDGDYMMTLRSPEIRVFKKKTPMGEVFVVKAEKNSPRVFRQFEEIVTYFDNYKQPEIDKELH